MVATPNSIIQSIAQQYSTQFIASQWTRTPASKLPQQKMQLSSLMKTHIMKSIFQDHTLMEFTIYYNSISLEDAINVEKEFSVAED